MDRRQFMRELGTGLFKTFREVAAPFIESDLEKLSRLTDRWAGYQYHPLALPESGVFADAWVSGEPLMMHKENGQWAVYSGRCPACGKVLQYLAYTDRVSCFGCGSVFSWEPEEAGPAVPGLKRLPLRRTKGQVLVGLPGKEKAHA